VVCGGVRRCAAVCGNSGSSDSVDIGRGDDDGSHNINGNSDSSNSDSSHDDSNSDCGGGNSNGIEKIIINLKLHQKKRQRWQQ
jgi:hypothetical protein